MQKCHEILVLKNEVSSISEVYISQFFTIFKIFIPRQGSMFMAIL